MSSVKAYDSPAFGSNINSIKRHNYGHNDYHNYIYLHNAFSYSNITVTERYRRNKTNTKK